MINNNRLKNLQTEKRENDLPFLPSQPSVSTSPQPNTTKASALI
jgi:hypothetical protein